MANTKEQQLQAFTRRAARVSKALWPTNVRHSIVTSKGAQTRRQLIVKSRYGKWSDLFPVRLGKRGRPQGSPPLFLSAPALTMNVRNVAGITTIAAASLVALLVAHRWLLILLFIIMLVVISLLLMIVRMRVSSVKHSMHGLRQGDERKSLPGVLSKTRSPNTPVPLDPPLVRVLETFDLSQTNVEHFLDLPGDGNTGGYSLANWKEAQTSLPKIVRK
ncbi:MAG TPA: hypothetical protein VGN15_03055 [Ktedonobacteraceae bacterium]|nr:hypothetical protein [Ktedonobacteraceae bacterium]